MARAALNIIGKTGAKYFMDSAGGTDVDCYRKDVGVYCVTGSQGMVPYPPEDVGWGYTLHPSESRAEVETDFQDGLLTIFVTMRGVPYDLKTIITLHILVPEAPVVQPPVITPTEAVAEEQEETPAEV
ncbi:hypothetical protein BFW86_16750 [Pseudomonas fluorescens]|nr:hypothetical protein BFW86_16750 [Pseudomonas fluorescens]